MEWTEESGTTKLQTGTTSACCIVRACRSHGVWLPTIFSSFCLFLLWFFVETDNILENASIYIVLFSGEKHPGTCSAGNEPEVD